MDGVLRICGPAFESKLALALPNLSLGAAMFILPLMVPSTAILPERTSGLIEGVGFRVGN